MGKQAGMLLVFGLAGLVGFALGFAWGSGTRSALGDATKTNYSGGKLTIEVDTTQAARAGLSSLLG